MVSTRLRRVRCPGQPELIRSPNRNLAPLSTDIDPEGRLRVGECVLSSWLSALERLSM